MFSAIVVSQNIAKSLRIDVTEQRLYTLSDGTRQILAGLNQPITMKLYYTKTAALKGPDQIRYYNNYYHFVGALLEEYVAEAKGMIDLQVIDPRPFSDDELAAIRYGLKRFSISEDESFFFGLVVQTQFGVQKVIDFFSPDRQRFVEYDISYLIDTATTREKKRIGILSSLPIMGDEVTGYMAQLMRMQGQQPKPAWGIVQHLQQKYEVKNVPPDSDAITDVDILLVIHPKGLAEKTLFAIDQFILTGGRAVICIDPHCVTDTPDRTQMQMGQMHPTNSNVPKLLAKWGLKMPENTFAGDRKLAVVGPTRANQRPEKIIGILQLNNECFSKENVISADLNAVTMMFPGVLDQILPAEGEQTDAGLKLTPLVMTTSQGNSWTVSSPYEFMMPNYASLLSKFTDGTKPVTMAYLVTGNFKSAFPDGIEVVDESADDEDQADESTETDDEQESEKTKIVTGLTESTGDCAVVVFADVDFISDRVAYRQTFFGMTVVGDNGALMLNAVEDLAGSGNLISIRSRGNFKRPFKVVDQIEIEAEAETSDEESKINAEIAGFQQELNQKLSSMKEGQDELIKTTILSEKRTLELKIAEAQKQLRQIKNKKRERIEKLGVKLRNFCTLPGPAVTLIIAIILGIRRSAMRRHYISHASDS
jgi:ABC-type uncharacterized transport system involved in gliding motility auxiliary subunit